MARIRATLAFLLLLSGSVACDTAGEHEGCADGTDPSACPRSLFKAQDSRAHEISGIVRRGEDGVPGATLHVEESPAAVRDGVPAVAMDAISDSVGFYRVPGFVPSFYDMTFRLPGGPGGRDDVLVYRNITYRYQEPQLDVAGRTLPRSWTGHVIVRFDAPIAEGHALLFLASGDGVYGVTGDVDHGLDVHTQKFVQNANIRAVEYDPAKGLISASAYGKADVLSDAGTAKSLMLHMDPITGTATPTFTLDAPPDFVPETIDVRIGSSRTSDALLVSIPWGTTMTVPVIPDQGYTYQLKAKRADGAIADSGEQGFDLAKTTAIKLEAPPELVAPAEGATLAAGELLSATGSGILEHVFEPTVAGAPSIHVIVNPVDTTMPDLQTVGLPSASGFYTWTVRRFPNMILPENMFGVDCRRYRPITTSAPRTILLR